MVEQNRNDGSQQDFKILKQTQTLKQVRNDQDKIAMSPKPSLSQSNGTPRNDIFKRWWFWVIVILLFALIVSAVVYLGKDKTQPEQTSQTNSIQNKKVETKFNTRVVFTARIFDPNKVSHILPLGELNGGYIETQTINGVMVQMKKNVSGNTDPMEIYAPTDMTLEDYAYAPDPLAPNRPVQWHLGFRLSKDMKLSFDHISWVPDEIKAATPPTQNSGSVPPTKKLSFKAGDLIAKTSGTKEASNWNIYLRDNKKTNTFVNQERYEKVREMYSFVNAVCPFDYYDEPLKSQYLSLMGYSKAGQSKTCGSTSRDVKGSISGLWHISRESDNSTFMGKYEGQYAAPFSIYKTSADEIVLYEINRKRYILGIKNTTYKDPATVTDSHCYNLTEYGDDRSTKGYAYFKVMSDTEIKLSFSSSGTCPASFPESNAKTYYR